MTRIVLERAFDPWPMEGWKKVVELRRCLRQIGCDPDAVVIEHPGSNFVMYGMAFVHRGPSPLERFLDQEIGA